MVIAHSNRLTKPPDHPITYDRKTFLGVIEEMAAKLKLYFELWPTDEFMKRKGGKLRKRYDDTAVDILENGYEPKKHSRISMFLKVEDYGDEGSIFKPAGGKHKCKDPRMISNRDTRFNLGYQKFTTAIERAMYHCFPQIMKGRNAFERGYNFRKLVLRSSGYYLKTDFGRFDCTQRPEVLFDLECGLMQHLLSPADYELFFSYWVHKLYKVGRYPNGLEFKLLGCRGSGDMDTGVFNTLLNYATAVYFLRKNGFDEGSFIVDGDDGVIWIPSKQFTPTWHEFGLNIDIELVSDYHDVTFCSSHFMQINKAGEFMQVQNIPKIIQKIGTLKNTQFEHCAGDYYYSLGYMYNKMYPEFPVFKQLSAFLMGLSRRSRRFQPDFFRTANPHYLDYMAGLDTITVDSDFILSEYYLCYPELGPSSIEHLMNYLATAKVHLPPENDKRYRVSGRAATYLPDHLYRTVEKIIDNAMVNSPPPSKLMEAVITFLTTDKSKDQNGNWNRVWLDQGMKYRDANGTPVKF